MESPHFQNGEKLDFQGIYLAGVRSRRRDQPAPGPVALSSKRSVIGSLAPGAQVDRAQRQTEEVESLYLRTGHAAKTNTAGHGRTARGSRYVPTVDLPRAPSASRSLPRSLHRYRGQPVRRDPQSPPPNQLQHSRRVMYPGRGGRSQKGTTNSSKINYQL